LRSAIDKSKYGALAAIPEENKNAMPRPDSRNSR
jgi:hypothetical protein